MSPYVPTGRPRGRPRKDSIRDDSLPKGRKYIPTGRPRGRPRKNGSAEGAEPGQKKAPVYVPTGRPRGRPRKNALAEGAEPGQKKAPVYVPTGRPRGRPRKNQSAVSPAEVRTDKIEVEKRGRGRPPAVAKQIEQAIKGRQLAAFRYEGRPRIAEIHSYGIMAGRGHEVASGFQTAGYSRKGRLPGWRLYNLERITEFTLTTRTFNVRPGYTPDDPRFRKLIAKI